MITQRPGGSARLGLHSLGITLCGTSGQHCFHMINGRVRDSGMTLLLPCGCDRTEYTQGARMKIASELLQTLGNRSWTGNGPWNLGVLFENRFLPRQNDASSARLGTQRKTLLKEAEEAVDLVLLPRLKAIGKQKL